jgi:hypothetical protein
MYAAKAGHSTLGIPQKVGAEFIGASHGITGLPKRKKQAAARADWGPRTGVGYTRSTPSRADAEHYPSFGRLSLR